MTGFQALIESSLQRQDWILLHPTLAPAIPPALSLTLQAWQHM